MSVPRTAGTRRERRLAERAARHGTRRQPRPARRLGLGALSALGLIGGLALVAFAMMSAPPPVSPAGDTVSVAVARVPSALPTQGFVLGQADAPVTIDLYEDFQCPACAEWGQGVFPSLVTNELADGTARIAFHDMAFLGPESLVAGRAAYAAAQQGSFWDMWATLYANQGRENSGAFSRARLLTMADRLGLDVAIFEADMDSREAEAAIDAFRADAARAGVTSTPTLIIGGETFAGVQPYPDIAAAIAAAAQ